jgi:hypothetical protein
VKKIFFAGGFILAAGIGFLRGDVIPTVPDLKTETSSSTVVYPSSHPIVLQEVRNTAFCAGEKLTFLIKYEFVGAGTATMEVGDGAPIEGRPTLHIESKAESNKFVDSFFKVRDFNASTLDAASLASLNFHQNLKEGGYQVIRNTSFDYKHHSYKFQKVKKGHVTERTGPVQEPLQDILSAFFLTRTLPLKPGETYEITVFNDEDVYSLVVKVHPKIQKITVPAGKFECLQIDPGIKGDAIFQAKEGKMTIWLTNDESRIPVLIRTRVFIGAVDAELSSFSLGR